MSGLAMGLHPSIDRHDPLLDEKTGEGEFQVAIDGENGRANLNRLLLSGHADVLERLWIEWGLSSDEAQSLNDCLQDWIEPTDLKRLNGAKQADYAKLGHPEYPPGRPFQSISEATQVIGFGKVMKLKPDWRDFFTLFSDGALDLNEAPADLIAAFCDVGWSQAASFVTQRDPGGVKRSPNGIHYDSVQAACAALGMPSLDVERNGPLLTVDGRVWRIASTGIVGDHRHTIVVVAARSQSNPSFLLWQEF
jgi:type II secretory pathway component PulK